MRYDSHDQIPIVPDYEVESANPDSRAPATDRGTLYTFSREAMGATGFRSISESVYRTLSGFGQEHSLSLPSNGPNAATSSRARFSGTSGLSGSLGRGTFQRFQHLFCRIEVP